MIIIIMVLEKRRRCLFLRGHVTRERVGGCLSRALVDIVMILIIIMLIINISIMNIAIAIDMIMIIVIIITRPRPAFGRLGLGRSSGGKNSGDVSTPHFAPSALSSALKQCILALLSRSL